MPVGWATLGSLANAIGPRPGRTTVTAVGRRGFPRTGAWPPRHSWPARCGPGPSRLVSRRRGAQVTACTGRIGAGAWGGRQRPVNTGLVACPQAGWTRLRAGDGAKGPHWDAGRWLPRADPVDPTWRRGLLVRRRSSAPAARRAEVICAPQVTTLAEVVRVAGARVVLNR
jgi:hypothetical protein